MLVVLKDPGFGGLWELVRAVELAEIEPCGALPASCECESRNPKLNPNLLETVSF